MGKSKTVKASEPLVASVFSTIDNVVKTRHEKANADQMSGKKNMDKRKLAIMFDGGEFLGEVTAVFSNPL